MKLLLDTHILLWSLLDPGQLSMRVADELENTSNELQRELDRIDPPEAGKQD